MKWLKNLFVRKEQKTLEEIRTWVEEQQKQQQETHERVTRELKESFPHHIQSAREALVVLEEATLKNPNIPERAKHIMEGNRSQFLKNTTRLLDSLEPPVDMDEIKDFGARLHSYAQSVARPGAILGEFFRNELAALKQCLGRIEQGVSTLQQSYADKEKFDRIHAQIDAINQVGELREQVIAENERVNARKEELHKRKPANVMEQQELKLSAPYKAVQLDVQRATQKRQQASQALSDILNPVRSVIKVYAHDKNLTKLKPYGEQPVQALLEDYNLRILDYVSPMRRAIEEGSLSVPDSSQVLAAFARLNKQELGSALAAYGIAKKEEAECQQQLSEQPIMKQLRELKEEADAIHEELKQLETHDSQLPSVDAEREKLNELISSYQLVLAQ